MKGRRAHRPAILMRHLQQVLNAFPSRLQVPPTDVNAQSIPIVSDKVRRSNTIDIRVALA
jgi:hypothetical protein